VRGAAAGLRVVGQEQVDVIRRHGFAEQKALTLLAAFLEEELTLFRLFDSSAVTVIPRPRPSSSIGRTKSIRSVLSLMLCTKLPSILSSSKGRRLSLDSVE
jgi:hypothetical protein